MTHQSRIDWVALMPDVARLLLGEINENLSSETELRFGNHGSMSVDLKKGVWQAGGFPVEIPAFTLGETFQKPTTMMYRNLLAMETEELLRSYPAAFDGVLAVAATVVALQRQSKSSS